MPSKLLALAHATRPWSIPASLLPTLLSLTLARTHIQSWVDAVAPSLAVLALHLFGNVVNTLGDYASGLDTRAATTDDRALVDERVTPAELRRVAAALLLGGVVVLCYYASVVGWGLLIVAALGVLLAGAYTAGPVPLKWYGLGDAVIAACFGPLLTCGVAAAASRGALAWDERLASSSLACAAIVVAILHANNTRDSTVDARAGAMTLARALGFDASARLYAGLLAVGFAAGMYLIAAAAAAERGVDVAALRVAAQLLLRSGVAGLTPAVAAALRDALSGTTLLLAGALPAAGELVTRFYRRDLALLPQGTAEYVGTFSGLLLLALHTGPGRERARAAAALGAAFVVHAREKQPGRARITVEGVVALLVGAQMLLG